VTADVIGATLLRDGSNLSRMNKESARRVSTTVSGSQRPGSPSARRSLSFRGSEGLGICSNTAPSRYRTAHVQVTEYPIIGPWSAGLPSV